MGEHAMHDACYTCRRRHIECDRSQVPCAKCQKAGLECFATRPLRWVKGVAIRGKMQGLSFDKTSDGSMTRAKAKRPTALENPLIKSSINIIDPTVATYSEPNGTFNGALPGLPLVLEDPLLSNLDGASRYYLDYYNERICKLFIVYDSDKNPLRSLIPLAYQDPVLLKATLALAARHRANTGQSFYQPESMTSVELSNAHQDALFFKYQAVQGLSHAMSDAASYRQDTTVASVFLLIFLDLLESGSDRWNFHLEGAKQLITLIQSPPGSPVGTNQDPGRTVEQIRNFIVGQLYLIETLGATFVRPRLLSQFIPLDQTGTRPQECAEQSFLGCPEYLLNAVQYFHLQRDAIAGPEPLTDVAIQNHIQEITAMLESIKNFDCYLWASNLPQSPSSMRDLNHLCTLSETFKISALIYGQRVLDALTKNDTLQDAMVSELIGRISTLKQDTETFKCILWPIIIAGLDCRWQAQRDFLVSCIEKFWTYTNCFNAINAAKILLSYWQQEGQTEPFSSQWIFNIGCSDRDWLLI